MKEAHLRDFIAVVAHGGVRAAARQLGLTQAAVSRNVLALEKACGTQLLVRSRHGAELTEPGRILLRGARAAVAELKKAQDDIEALSGERSGWVSIGVPPGIEALCMSEAIERFRARFPSVLVRVTGGPTATTIPGLREGRLDFILGSAGRGREDGLQKEQLMVSGLEVVARSGHPLASATSLAELQNEEWVVGIPTGVPKAEMHAIYEKAGLPAPTVGVQRDSISVVHLLSHSDRVAIIAKGSTQLFCDAGILRVLPLKDELPLVPVNLITVAGRDLTPPAQALAAEFKRLIREKRGR